MTGDRVDDHRHDVHQAVDGDDERASDDLTALFEFICNENETSTPHMHPNVK